MTYKKSPQFRQHGLSILLLLALIVLCTLLAGVGMYYALEYISDRPATSVHSPKSRISANSSGNERAPLTTTSSKKAFTTTDDELYPDTDPYELTRQAGASDEEVESAREQALQAPVDDTQADIVIAPEIKGDANRRGQNRIEEDKVVQPDAGAQQADVDPDAVSATQAEQENVSDSVSDSAASTDENGDLIVVGKVITPDGRGVSAMTVRLKRIGAPANTSATATQTNAEGGFRFNGLKPGDYSLVTMETSDYSSVTTIVKAGVTSAELRVAGRKRVLVSGRITGEEGNPIANARIQTPTGDGIVSSASGHYRLAMIADPDRSYSLRFNAAGYREETRHVHASAAEQSPEILVDVKMTKAGGVTAKGTVLSATGQPVTGATVWLTSPGLNVRGQALTDELGAFLVPGLKPAADYRIIVNRAGFSRYQQNNVELEEQSLPLAIELKVLPVGNITGLITDVDGTPVPDFTINVVSVDSNGQALTVASDDNGYFQADGIPSGEIRFQTRSKPSISLTGLKLPEGQRIQADLVVDWGNYSISGIVQNEDGEPYAQARIIARWNATRHGLVSDSTRISQTNPSGEFSFTELGPGPHEIIVESNGTYLQKSVSVDPRSRGQAVTIKVDRIQ